MPTLLSDLAHLSGLRERQALGFALVHLLLRHAPWGLHSVRLMRAAGPTDDQRWVVLASLQQGQAKPAHDAIWLDTSALLPMSSLPQHEAAIVTESIIQTGQGPFATLFPINTNVSVCSLLEATSAAPLPSAVQSEIDSVLLLFENLQGLLDYGERDALTELLNRKTFDGAFLRAAQSQHAEPPPEQAERRHTQPGQFWLAVIDIDHFKLVNDRFGHLIGDEVLLLLARLMRASFRHGDQLYRFGGEEFVVLLRCASHAHAQAAAERFRLKVEQHSFVRVEHITVSIGLAPVHANDTPTAAFDRADQAVYHAKAHGRNQVCSFEDLVAQGVLAAPADDEDDVDFF
jgi:diguanylate cyclase (GGDEF)-like protein